MNILLADSAGISAALDILRAGGVVAHATETCYGFACDLRNPAAVEKLFRIKKRPSSAPVSGLFSSITEAKKYVSWNADAEDLARDYLPGPLTIILPMKKNLPQRLYPHPPAPSPPRGRGGDIRKDSALRSYRPSTVEFARTLRQGETSTEKILWDILRHNSFHGLHFRRQHPIGKYILDFYCDSIKLGIEIDGSVHDKLEQKEKDTDRTEYMNEAGIQILRVSNDDILNNLQNVLESIGSFVLPSTPEGGGVRGGGVSRTGEGVTLGIRISSHPLAQELATKFGFPISTTSANLHGEPNPYDAKEIVRQLEHSEFQPDLILDSGKLPRTPPSTVVDLTGKAQSVRRQGGVMPR